MLIAILSGFALALGLMSIIMYQTNYKELEREYRLTQLEIDDFRIALIQAGIELPHGDKP